MTTPASPSRGTTSSSSHSTANFRLNSSSAWIDTTNLLFLSGQQHSQLFQPSAGRGFDSSLGDREGRGGLGDRRVEQVPEDENLALHVRQLAQRPDQDVPPVDRLGERHHRRQVAQ